VNQDYDALVVGDRFETRGRTVTEGDVAAFASLTGDMHPQHTDAVWAASSPFGARVAHGMLVLSYALGLVAFDPERVIALRGVRQAVFKRPVRLGDTIHARATIDGLDAIDDAAGLVRIRVDVLNQDDRIVCRAAVDVLWRRGADPEHAAATAEDAEPELLAVPF
jgi:3-hydroxybutyryl-CoA dehydratase